GATVASELAALAAIAAPRYAAGDLDLVGDYYLGFGGRLLDRAQRRGDEPGLVAALEPAVLAARRLGGGHRALAPLGRILGHLQQGVGPTAAPFAGSLTSFAPHGGASLEIARRIADAIAVGAPAYNVGDAERCYRIYAHTASAIVSD